jgi:hypothetical protein
MDICMVRHMGKTVQEAEHVAQCVPDEMNQLRSKPAFRRFAHLGLGARAAIYFLLAYMAADIALTRSSPAPPSASGAMAELARPPGGRVLVSVLAVGLAGYGCWRLAQALSKGTGEASARQASERIGWAATGVLYLLLCGQAVALVITSAHPGSSGSGGASSHPQPWVAMVLRWPAGPVWVGLAGLVVAVSGLVLLVWGAVHDYSEILDTERMSPAKLRVAQATGIAGEAARGLLIILVSAYLLAAAVTDRPQEAKSLDQALHAFAKLPAGPPLLLVVAVGLACFALYSLFEAFYRPA